MNPVGTNIENFFVAFKPGAAPLDWMVSHVLGCSTSSCGLVEPFPLASRSTTASASSAFHAILARRKKRKRGQ
jgi:hypothetical protein